MLASDGIVIGTLIKGEKQQKVQLNKEVAVTIEMTQEKCEPNDSMVNLNSHFLSNNKSEVRGKCKYILFRRQFFSRVKARRCYKKTAISFKDQRK